MIPKLTEAQAETLHALFNSSFANGGLFSPNQAFPKTDNRDTGHRRTFQQLVHKGLFVDAGVLDGVRQYQANAANCWDAWYQWHDANPDGTERWE